MRWLRSFRGWAGRRWAAAGAVALALLVVSGGVASAGEQDEHAPRFKILVDEDDVYSVHFEDLVAAGLPPEARPATAALGITGRGEPVPLWAEDGGDGRFGPGDRIEFVGTHPAGEHSYLDPHTRYNVYFLDLAAATPRRTAAAEPTSCGEPAGPVGVVRREENRLRARFPRASQETDEVWYWARLSHADRKPLDLALDLPGLDRSGGGNATLTLHFRGWSSLPPVRRRGDVLDHRVEVEMDGQVLGAAEWNNAPGGHRWQSAPIDAAGLHETGNRLRLRIPVRRARDTRDPLIDALLLDWVELRYPLVGVPARGAFWIVPPGGDCIPAAGAGSATIHGPDGMRFVLGPVSPAGGHGWRLEPHDGEGGELRGPYLVAGGRSPDQIRIDRPSALADGGAGADYLIVAHSSLLDAVSPLAALHRSRGLRVGVAEVEDVYDEFNHGIPSPAAIRDFVRHAYRRWRRPAPRFLLLVGDASWDMRNHEPRDESYADWTFRGQPSAGFVKNRSTSLERPERRAMVPTWDSPTYEGDAASDNYFVAVDGDDELPDLAVGRLPAATPDEARVMVEKTLTRYRAAPGPWRRRVLWLTNEKVNYQRRTDRMIQLADLRGLASTRIYPSPDEPSNEGHQAAIRRAFDEGQAIVHFLGHGGRYIWRTGPPDLRKNHDLFTLEDLERLAPTSRLPIVLSMTCYSAPFDHPTADSIGEKLLRLSGRGAVAVIAASWRNSPNQRVDVRLMQEIMAGGTVGEALQRTKRAARNVGFVRQYNLLGDPALPVPIPPPGVEVEAVGDDASRVRARIPPWLETERAAVEWVDERGGVVHVVEEPVVRGVVEAAFGGPAERLAEVALVRVYAWGTVPAAEAVGVVSLSSDPTEQAAHAPPGRGRRHGN